MTPPPRRRRARRPRPRGDRRRRRSPTSRCATAGRSGARSSTATRRRTCPRCCSRPRATMTIRGEGGERRGRGGRLLRGLPDDGGARTARSSRASRCRRSTATGTRTAKFNRRREDWAMVAVCALVKQAGDGSCEDVRIGLTHMGSTPLRATRGRGGAARAAARRRAHRRGRRAGRRGHRPAGRPQRDAGVQAPPRARAVPARADRGGRALGRGRPAVAGRPSAPTIAP